MVIKHASAGGYSIDSLLNTSRKPRLSRTNVFALMAVALAHLGLALYLYSQHFTPSRVETQPDPAPFVLEIPRWQPENVPPTHRAAARPLPVHTPAPVTIQTQNVLSVRPQPTTPTTPTTLSSLPTGDLIQSPPSVKLPRVITDPQWLSRPSAD